MKLFVNICYITTLFTDDTVQFHSTTGVVDLLLARNVLFFFLKRPQFFFKMCRPLFLSLRNLKPLEGDVHPHSQLRHESSHAQHANSYDARSGPRMPV